MGGYKVTICDKCPKDGSICSYCHGKRVWITNGFQKLYINWPINIDPEKASTNDKLNKSIKVVNAVFFSLTVYFFIKILISSDSVHDFINPWQKDYTRSAFGLFGLISLALYFKSLPQKTKLKNLTKYIEQLQESEDWICLDSFVDKEVYQTIYQAGSIAQKVHYTEVTPEIFLLASINSGSVRMLLKRMEVDPEKLSVIITASIPPGNTGYNRQILLSQTIEVFLYSTVIYSIENHFSSILTWSVLPIYLREKWPQKESLEYFGVTAEKIEKVIDWYKTEDQKVDLWNAIKDAGITRPKSDINKGWTAVNTPYLDQISKDLTVYASYGVGNFSSIRTEELSRVLQILSRTNKRNVLLVGNPGMGKNTLVESIAGLMVKDEVPEELKDSRLVSLNMIDVIHATEENDTALYTILDEIAHAGNVILYMPDIENIANNTSQTANATSVLASALKNNQIQIISTSTPAEYHKYLENNPELESLFEVIQLSELNEKECLKILEEEVPQIESSLKVSISFPALEKAIKLCIQHTPDQSLPESAITLIDEAASYARSQNKNWLFASDVIKTFEKKTRIKVDIANSDEADLLLNFEKLLKTKIVGQQIAVTAVSAALRRSRTGMHNQNKPISTFLFVGPTGVGKTELSKAVTELFFNDKHKMITLDMSEYQDETSINKIIGAPQAVADSPTQGSHLTKYVKDNPYCLILLDEIEKCHKSVQDLFLQMLDEGRLTDNTGNIVDFRNTIIVATSNAGSTDIYNLVGQGVRGESLNKQTIQILNQYFKPEFLNRFDAIIPFSPLSMDEVKQIVTLLLDEVKKKTAENGYVISFSEDVISYLAENGYDPQYGARPLRRIIQDKIETLLADLILEKKIVEGSELQINAEMLKYLK